MTRRDCRGLVRLVAAVGLVAATTAGLPGAALASSHFLDPSGRPTGVHILSELRIHALAGFGETANFLAWKTLSSGWTTVANPPGVKSFFMDSSVAGVEASSVGGPRVFAISASDPAGSQLWEYEYDGSGVGSWNHLGVPGGADFDGAPYLTAALDASDGSVWVAVRTAKNSISNDDHLWTCHMTSDTCDWVDRTCRDGTCNLASPVSAMARDTYKVGSTPEEAFYIVDQGGHIRRYLGSANKWDTLPLAGGDAVDTVALQAWHDSSKNWVAAMAKNPVTGQDQLAFFSANIGDNAWTSYLPSGGSAAYPTFNGLAVGVTGGSATAYLSTPSTLWACDWTGSYCDWSQPGVAPDQLGSQTVGGGSWAEDASSVFFTGSLSSAEYLFHVTLISGLQGTYRWDNHLAPHDPGAGSLPVRNVGEYDADEYGGVVVFTAGEQFSPDFPLHDCNVEIWRSTDDWNTYSAPQAPFPGGDGLTVCGDQTVSFDKGGTAFVTSVLPGRPLDPHSALIVRWDEAAGNWTTPYTIPPTDGMLYDRPILLADRTKSNFLFLTWSAGQGTHDGKMTYCWGGAGQCTADPSGWCSPLDLPSNKGCTGPGNHHNAGCWIDQSGDGTVWVMVQDDALCTSPPGPEYKGIGIRQVTNRGQLGSSCTPISLSQTPECIYYVPYADPSQLNGGEDQPAAITSWSARLYASRDNTDRVSVELQSFQALDGGPCRSGVQCRGEQYFAYRVGGTTGWCGKSCSTTLDPSTMLHVNQDQPAPPLPWVDHLLSGGVALDYGQWGVAWLDFRGDPAEDHVFNLALALITFDPATHVASSAEEPFWAENGLFALKVTDGSGTYAWYGDLNRWQVNGRGHAHFFEEYASPKVQQYTTAWFTYPWSPAAP